MSIPVVLDADRQERVRTFSLENADPGLRELIAVREITQAFLTAPRPGDVYQFALDRVSPLVGATLACVYLIDEGTDVMRLRAAYNWPERYTPFLGEMRVRLNAGPSGTAAAERRVVEVADVFADESGVEWREVATELAFRSLVALPLQTRNAMLGAVTFYFTRSGAMSAESLGLLRVVANQMAATAEKARLIDDLSRANGALQQTNAELEKQYVAVLEARRLQDEFLANVSHELRTPLTAVMGYLALIDEGLAGPVTPEQRETLSQVKSASEKLLGLVGDLLDLTSLKRGELSVNVTTFDPREALREALACTEGRRSGVALVVEPAASVPLMTSDRRKLTRLASALLSNAFKFTERGEVRVSLGAEGDHLILRISDTGVGISEEAQQYVFDEFRQEDGSATRRFGGSGLGLAIARRLARVLGGEITLSSQRGKGSSFQAQIPLVYGATSAT